MIGGLIGKKIGMTHVFDEKGRFVPVTVLEIGPCFVTQVRSAEHDGYRAAQIGFGQIAKRKVNKPTSGHLQRVGLHEKPLRHLKEFPILTDEIQEGQTIKVDQVFSEGETVRITGTSKGKGFAGVVKRYHFHGGPMTHGSMTHRRPLSSGATGPQRVFKNTRKPGRMGGEQVTQRDVTVVQIDPSKNLMLIKGSVPGANGETIYVLKQN